MHKAARSFLVMAPVVLGLFCNSPHEPARRDPPAGMKLITGGTFLMGSADSADGVAQPVRSVTVGSFYMDSTEVTQYYYTDLREYNPSTFKPNPYYPVDSVTWYDAVLYANARSKREHRDTVYSFAQAHMRILLPNNNPGGKPLSVTCTTMTGLTIDYSKKGYRLPTEAEWEYACRGGKATVNYWGDNLEGSVVDTVVWYDGNSSWHLNFVAWYEPNNYGLYDMIGNAWEWCNDWYADGYAGPTVNPIGPGAGTERVKRGGAHTSIVSDGSLRSAARAKENPGRYRLNHGFRLVLPL